MATVVKTASVLAFERRLDPSDALLFATKWEERTERARWRPIPIREKSVRGTISNRLKAKEQDPAKLDAAIQKPNLQTIDVASLDPETDTLVAQFSLRVLPDVGVPSACNSDDYRQRLGTLVEKYISSHGLTELGRRYAHNLANGRFLWRNRIGAESIEVQITHSDRKGNKLDLKFDALSLSLRNFYATGATKESLDKLGEVIATGLQSEHALLNVTAFVRIGAGQEVFPSQELLLDSRGRGDKSKTLYHVNLVAGMHSQKLGNAIRTIDTWYPGSDDAGPIAVEPYGSVTTLGKAYRQPKEKVDFYTLLDGWALENKEPSVENQHFVIAVLIRGGVFGEKEDR